MPVDECDGRVFGENIAFKCALVNLRQGVVQPSAVAERLVDRGIETI